MSQSKTSLTHGTTRKDVTALGVGTLLVGLAAYVFDSDEIIAWFTRHSNSKIDEAIIAAVVTLILTTVWISVFVFRKWQDLGHEIARCRDEQKVNKENEERSQRVLRATNDAIWDWDVSTDTHWWNGGIQTLFGYAFSDVDRTLEFWTQRIHPEDIDQVMASFHSVAESKVDSWIGKYRFRRADGTYANVLDRAIIVRDETGKLARVTGSMMDVTEHKRNAEELLRAKEAAEAANHAKSEFLANMSHEIRTPLNGILGMSELALETELSKEQREYLVAVQQSADALLTVINDILDFSKIEAHKMDFDSIEFNLRDTAEDAVGTVSFMAHQKNLELSCEIAQDVPEIMTGDPNRLRQIIVNLMGNAVKFTEQGEVALHVKSEPAEENQVRLHFSVRDTGIGIPIEKQAMIFDAFSQADSSAKRKFGGTGLGLAICTALSGMMGGRIWVESEVGAGSTFHFTARFAAALSKNPPGKLIEAKELSGVRVLVVDDNPTNCRILRDTVAGWKMDVTSVSNGGAAVKALELGKAENRAFALVLTDGHMPGINGFELASRIKHDPKLARTAILMLTSDKRRGDLERCRELGITAYLVKPVRQKDLLSAVRESLTETMIAIAPINKSHAAVASDRPLRILLTEDNPINQTVATRMLEKRGHSVRVAHNGREALSALEHEPFDLILMDIQMPEMDGFEATAAIRERERSTGAHIPIVAMTAHAMNGDRERCLGAGMDGYVSKPIRLPELLNAIDQLLEKPPAPPAV